MDKVCPICNNSAPLRLNKGEVEYNQCINCRTLFSEQLENSGMIGGEFEEGRNKQQNHLRTARVDHIMFSAGKKKEDIRILDFGCGNGLLIKDLQELGYNCDGYDAYNEKYCSLPENNKYDIITCIELIEHTSKPFVEIDVMYRSLVDLGVVIFETSFIDVAEQENIELEDFHYIAPKNGHSTVFSHHGLDLLMALKGFEPRLHVDRHVRIFQKI